LPYEVNYYYGIRNNKITKLKKGFEHARLEKKIKDLSDEFKRDKGFNRPKMTYNRLKNGFTRPKYFDDQIDQILFLKKKV
jgi:hypothetical protein